MQITNQSNSNYEYKINPASQALSKNIQSNIITANLLEATLTMTKSVDKTYATIGDTLNYTINLSNTGSILLTNIILTDIMPTGSSFIAGSVKIDNVVQASADITKGINLGDLIILGTKTVTFSAKVDSLPNPNTLINKATSSFKYLLNLVSKDKTAESNTTTTVVNVSTLTILKSSSANEVEIGEEITFTNIITNSGNVIASNIVFQDVLDPHFVFKAGSVKINNTVQADYNPSTGFAVPNLNPTETATIEFKVTVS